MLLPNFLIVGAAKSGTTTLYEYLAEHPAIFLPDLKEPRFLAIDAWPQPPVGRGDPEMFAYACQTLPAYAALFEKAAPSQMRGEASADTFYYHSVSIPRIRTVLGDPKIIILLREPAARAFSAFAHLCRDDREQLSFEAGLREEASRVAQGYEFLWHYRGAGRYLDRVRAFRAAFSDVQVLEFSEFIENPLPVLQKICGFLGVDETHHFARRPSANSSGQPRTRGLFDALQQPSWWKAPFKMFLPPALRRRFKDRVLTSLLEPLIPDAELLNNLALEFESENAGLAEFLGRSLPWNKSGPSMC